MDTAYVITFPMVIGGLISLGGIVGGFWVKRQIEKADKESTEKANEDHGSFQKLHERIDHMRDKREEDLKQVHALELQVAAMISREELKELYEKIDAIRNEVKVDVQAAARAMNDMSLRVIEALTLLASKGVA